MFDVFDLRRPPLLRNCLALALATFLSAGLSAADRPKKELRETAALPTDKNAAKRLGPVQVYMADKRWGEAIDVLQDIAQSDGRMLVPPPHGSTGDSAVYLNVAARCNIALSQLPPEGLALYRKKVDPQAKRWLDRWKESHDEGNLQRIVREAYLSSYGDDALWELGEAAWDRGDIGAARLYWTQLVPLTQEAHAQQLPTVLRYPDSDLKPTDVLARLILCTLMEGDRDRAARELQRFTELFPNAEGSLAGRQGRMDELLAQILAESVQWKSPDDIGDVATFGINSSRGGKMPETVELGASKWSHSLPSNVLPPLDRPNLPHDRGPLSYYPVTYRDVVLVNNARSIWAWNLLTGEPAWPSEKGNAEIYSAVADGTASSPSQSCAGVPYYTMTISDGKLYARMGSPVTNPTDTETSSEASESDLICLDLEGGQGKLVWKTGANELIKDEQKQWRFEGSPLVIGGRAYVALSRRRTQLEFAIACIDATTGTLLWNRNVASTRSAVEDHQNRVSHLLLTAGAGKLYLSTDAGAIIAVDAKSGHLEWAITYESLSPARPHLLSSHFYQGLLPAIYHEGIVFVAPNDCNRVFCIEADSGRVRWQHKQPESDRWRHLLGVAPGGDAGRLIISGNTLWAIDIATNKTVFGSRSNTLGLRGPTVEQGYGRGVIAGDVILWPTREAIKIVNAKSGATIGSKPLQTPTAADIAGNLVLCQEMLLVAQPEKLVAYCEYSLLKQRLERELSERANPDGIQAVSLAGPLAAGNRLKHESTESLLGQLAEIESAEGNRQAATVSLRKAIKASESSGIVDDAAKPHFRQRLLELLRQMARTAMEEGHASVAIEHLTEAQTLSTGPADIVTNLLMMGDAQMAQSRPVAAVAEWQKILDSEPLQTHPMRQSTAGAIAASLIAKLIRERGRAVYAEIEHQANLEIASRRQANDLDGLNAALRRYPNAEASSQAWRVLADLNRRAGRISESLAIQARLLEEAGSPEVRGGLLLDWADTLEQAGYWRPAQSAWTRLGSKTFATQEIDMEGSQRRLGDVARERLARDSHYSVEGLPSTKIRSVDRAWTVALRANQSAAENRIPAPPVPSAAQVLAPESIAPAAGLECVLIHHAGDPAGTWKCLDRSSGKVRWRTTLTAPPWWVSYSETNLLLAINDQLIALAVESGRPLWTTSLTLLGEESERRTIPVVPATPNTLEAQDSSLQACFRGHWAFIFDPQSGVTAIDARTGDLAWTFQPPRGKLQSHWACNERHIAIQTLQPATTWLIDVAAKCQATDRPGSVEPWLQGPVFADDNALIELSADRRIESRSLLNGQRRWRFMGGMSFAHVDPVVWSAGSALMTTVDGTTLVRIDPLTGMASWTAGVADVPLMAPARQVISTGDAAYVASQGLLRQISLKTGECTWQRYLGTIADQWRLAICGDLVAAWPVESGIQGKPPRPGTRQSIVWCDRHSGHLVQTTAFAPGERVLNLTADELGGLVQTDQNLIAFRNSLLK